MKILIVSGFFYPINTPRAFRTTELAKELCKQGHDVTVCVPKIGFDYSQFLSKYRLKLDFIDIQPGIKRGKSANKLLALVRRFNNRVKATYLQYPAIRYCWRIPEYLRDKELYDAIISIAVPHPIHWGVARAIRNSKKPVCKVWIADCGDPFMLCKTDSFRKPFYFKYFEKDFCRVADYITVPTEESKNGYYPEFEPKIKVIPQGFDFSDVRILPYEANPIITFAYAGGFIPGIRDPRPLLDFLCEYDKPFKFYVYTKQNDLVSIYRERLGDKLIVSDYIDRLELIKRMSTYDFLINIENGTSVQTPSKLIDYALSKRPVLSLSSSNFDAVKFSQFLERDYSSQLSLPCIEKYNISNVAMAFVNLVEGYNVEG